MRAGPKDLFQERAKGESYQATISLGVDLNSDRVGTSLFHCEECQGVTPSGKSGSVRVKLGSDRGDQGALVFQGKTVERLRKVGDPSI